MSDEENTAGGGAGDGFVLGLIVGAVVGVAVAMLVAPQTGEEARDVLYTRSREAGGRVRDTAGDLGENARGVATTITSSAADLLARGRQIVEEARARVDDAVDVGTDAANDQRTNLEQQHES